MSVSKIVAAAASGVGGAGLDVDEVFSTHLYKGTGGTQSIVNNIDLSGEGGLVWIKGRTDAYSHYLHDTTTSEPWHFLQTNNTDARNTHTGNEDLTISAFNSNGFVIGSGSGVNNGWGGNNSDFTSWTFRKAPKFFDVVTFSATGSGSLTLSHNLGSTPAFIIVKSTSHAQSWYCYHHSLNGGTDPEDYFLKLDSDVAEAGPASSYWGGTAPTSTQFTVGTDLNISGRSYVAYLFAHNNNDGGFGPDGDQDIIKCGSYTGNASTDGPDVNLGFEPQWVMIKNTTSSADWMIFDVMRGIVTGGNDLLLNANDSDAENNLNDFFSVTSTGFKLGTIGYGASDSSGKTYIYMAIRRGPLAAPEDATKVFALGTRGASTPGFTSNFPVDMFYRRYTTGSGYPDIGSRLTGPKAMQTSETFAEGNDSSSTFDHMNGYYNSSSADSNHFSWMWKRAPGYFDVVAYKGTSPASGDTKSHNLGVVPEMIWVKNRDGVSGGARPWIVYHKDTGNTGYLKLNESDALITSDPESKFGNGTVGVSPTASSFTVAGDYEVNFSTDSYIAYLFATVDGVSKVGSFSPTGSTLNVDCGFSSGARFVLAKQTDSTEAWYLWDSVRGIVAGNDPYLYLNSTGAETTNADYIDPHSSGFTITTQFFGSGNFIFYAIA